MQITCPKASRQRGLPLDFLDPIVMKRYRTLFFDLDDTLWDFSGNSYKVYSMLFDELGYPAYFESFEEFFQLYEQRNVELWDDYLRGLISKDELNVQRYAYPFKRKGIDGCDELAMTFMRRSMEMMPTMPGVVEGAHEVLDELSGRYRLFILSNGFRELQSAKMQTSGLAKYFEKIVLSEDIMVHKPNPAIFNFALSATQSFAETSLMIGDNLETDIKGAASAAIDQVWLNPKGNGSGVYKPTYTITRLAELLDFL